MDQTQTAGPSPGDAPRPDDRLAAVAAATGADGLAVLFVRPPGSGRARDPLVEIATTLARETRRCDAVRDRDPVTAMRVPASWLVDLVSDPARFGASADEASRLLATSRELGANLVAHKLVARMDLDGPRLQVRREDLLGTGGGRLSEVMPTLEPLVAQPRFSGGTPTGEVDRGAEGVRRLAEGFGTNNAFRTLILDGAATALALRSMSPPTLDLLDRAIDEAEGNRLAMSRGVAARRARPPADLGR